jgi:hypothetical protein
MLALMHTIYRKDDFNGVDQIARKEAYISRVPIYSTMNDNAVLYQLVMSVNVPQGIWTDHIVFSSMDCLCLAQNCG